ncbi:hypothetical protein G6011_09424 [Alternaria panax]|uniref:Uncharacterized protein n=1 Tax=Alternaria panax TaxID=48097 RepID=A0AAD4IAY3_9PLEO|nr:hypothetical protein G6011_09424 [Alternaria panax]
MEHAEGLWVTGTGNDEQEAKDGEEARLCATIASMSHKADYWKARAEEYRNTIAELDKKTPKDAAGSNLPSETVRRLNRLESELTRLRSENAQLKETLKTIEYDNGNLGNQNDGKARKLKGADKKVRNAKAVAGNEEEKAKDAQGDRQRHLASERRMKKERADALAALQEQKKLDGDLRAVPEVEQSGAPHVRDAAADPNNTVAVIPVQFDICRIDVQPIMMVFEWHQINVAARFRDWYKDWKVSNREVRKVGGSEGVDDEKKKLQKLYGDMVGMPNSYIETSAEHDGWRSKRAAQVVCRYAEARHNADV